MSPDCPFTDEDLAFINNAGGIHAERNMDVFRWKIDSFSRTERCYLCVRRKNQLFAYFAVRRDKQGVCRVYDWRLPDDKTDAHRIMRTMIKTLGGYCNSILFYMIVPGSKESSLLAGGFSRNVRTKMIVLPLSSEISENDKRYILDIKNWNIKFMDVDMALNQ